LDIEINVAEGAPARYLLAGRVLEIDVGRLFVFWAGNPHHLLPYPIDKPVRLHWITVPLTWLQSWGFDKYFLGTLLSGACIAEERQHDACSTMAEWVKLSRDSGDGRQIALHEIHARLLRVQREWLVGKRQDLRQEQILPEAVMRILHILLQHYQEPLSVSDIAKQSGLHPNYAMNIFQRACGYTILHYVTDLRLAHAQRLLITTERKVTELALDAGFPSLSRFYACFQARWQMTPRAYRERFRA
jgi:AraC-like DNA-binding protein